MDQNTIKTIEGVINYTFKNKALLTQAFTRKSYTNEHGGEHNDTLEFFGDTVIGFITTNHLLNKYKTITEDGYFISRLDQNELTNLKADYVCKSALSMRMRVMKLDGYLLVGEGDKKLDIKKENSVLEDAFEALVAAMYIDSNQSIASIQEPVVKMLGLDDEDLGELFEKVREAYKSLTGEEKCHISKFEFDGEGLVIRMPIVVSKHRIGCFMFKGKDRASALEDALLKIEKAKKGKLIQFLMKIRPSDMESSINTVQELEQKHFISNVEYDYESIETDNMITWKASAVCTSEFFDDINAQEKTTFPWMPNIDKKTAKKMAACHLLTSLFGIDNTIHLMRLAKTVQDVKEDFSDPQYMELLAQIIAYQTTENEEMLDDYIFNLDWDLETFIRIENKLESTLK